MARLQTNVPQAFSGVYKHNRRNQESILHYLDAVGAYVGAERQALVTS